LGQHQLTALELNPVAHLIELCTLVYPQKYGKPDKNAKGSAPDGTWAGLANEVEYWGKWVLERVKEEIGDLYPPIRVPSALIESGMQERIGHEAENFVTVKEEEMRPNFSAVESKSDSDADAVKEFGFNPAEFSKGGNATCLFCGTVADDNYVKEEGLAKRMGKQIMALVCTKYREKGKVYLSADGIAPNLLLHDFRTLILFITF
jgi:putative DNA methylase